MKDMATFPEVGQGTARSARGEQWHEMFEKERKLLPPEDGYRTGLCLSGGGIRSAAVVATKSR